VTPAPLPPCEFYINRTLPNLRYNNCGDFKIRCKDGELMCHKIILESAETSHFRSIWLQRENEYEEKDYKMEIVSEMLKHLYNGECKPSFKLCQYADKIRMQSLCDFCVLSLIQKLNHKNFGQVLDLLFNCYITTSKRTAFQGVIANYYLCNYSKIENSTEFLPRILPWIGSFMLTYCPYSSAA